MHGTYEAERTARIVAEAKKPRDKRAWTNADDNNLTVMWRQGKLKKVIAHRLERSVASINLRRKRLGLPSRKKYRKKRINVEIDANAYQLLQRRAMERETTIAGYMRYLVARDLGEAT